MLRDSICSGPDCDGTTGLVKTVRGKELVRVRTALPYQMIPEKTDALPSILCRPPGANTKTKGPKAGEQDYRWYIRGPNHGWPQEKQDLTLVSRGWVSSKVDH